MKRYRVSTYYLRQPATNCREGVEFYSQAYCIIQEAVDGKMFDVTIIVKNLRTLKASNGQTVEHIDYSRT